MDAYENFSEKFWGRVNTMYIASAKTLFVEDKKNSEEIFLSRGFTFSLPGLFLLLF